MYYPTCIAANWKMNKTAEEASQTTRVLLQNLQGKLDSQREILIFPPFTALSPVGKAITGHPQLGLGGQNFYPRSNGSFTGEISPQMLADLGCTYALAGHSERRHILNEEDHFVGQKVKFGLEQNLKIILCIGETLEQRKQGRLEEVLRQQLHTGLAQVAADSIHEKLSIAYEPVWAIGTGEVAGIEDIKSAHAFVRRLLQEIFPEQGAQVRILYGGSVKPDNSSQILGLDNVNGLLVGGASLEAESFSQIARSPI